MNCEAGQKAGVVSGGAKTNTDGCEDCTAGTSSAGVASTTCTACTGAQRSAAKASSCQNNCDAG